MQREEWAERKERPAGRGERCEVRSAALVPRATERSGGAHRRPFCRRRLRLWACERRHNHQPSRIRARLAVAGGPASRQGIASRRGRRRLRSGGCGGNARTSSACRGGRLRLLLFLASPQGGVVPPAPKCARVQLRRRAELLASEHRHDVRVDLLRGARHAGVLLCARVTAALPLARFGCADLAQLVQPLQCQPEAFRVGPMPGFCKDRGHVCAAGRWRAAQRRTFCMNAPICCGGSVMKSMSSDTSILSRESTFASIGSSSIENSCANNRTSRLAIDQRALLPRGNGRYARAQGRCHGKRRWRCLGMQQGMTRAATATIAERARLVDALERELGLGEHQHLAACLQQGIPTGTVSRAARHPARRNVPHGRLSHKAQPEAVPRGTRAGRGRRRG